MAPRKKQYLTGAQRAAYAKILGVAVDADSRTIAQARKTLSRAHHPDRGGDAALMASINEAADALEDHLLAPVDGNDAPRAFSSDKDWAKAAGKANAQLVLLLAEKHLKLLKGHDRLAAFFGLPLRNPPAFRVHVHRIAGVTYKGKPHVFYDTRMEPGFNLFSHPVFLGQGMSVATHQSDPSFHSVDATFSGTKTFVLNTKLRTILEDSYKGQACFHFGVASPRTVDIRDLAGVVKGSDAPDKLSQAAQRLLDGRLPKRCQPIVAVCVFPMERLVRSIAKMAVAGRRAFQRLFAPSIRKRT